MIGSSLSLSPSLSLSLCVCVSICGAGDLFQNDYKDMIEKFRALPSKPKIYVVLPPPLLPPWPYNMSATAVSVYIARSCRRWRRTVHILCVW